MAVKRFLFLKVFMFLIFLNVSEGRVNRSRHASVDTEINEIRKETIAPITSETKSSSDYVSSSVGAIKRMITALPSPSQIVQYGKQALIGVPEEVVSHAKRFLCSKVVKLNDKAPEYHPKADVLNFEYLTHDSDNVTIPIGDSAYLFNHPKFRMNWNVVLFVSGWNVNAYNETIAALYNAYRCRGGYNFLVLDTSKFVDSMYAWSEFSTEPIGKLIGEAIKNLTRLVPYERFHLIGEGIGAHIAGMAGRYFTKMTGKALPRITGFDPSIPCFSESDRPNGLQRGDAMFVDIIHSNVELCGLDPMADADFFPNGPSIIQHGCWSTSCTKNHAYQFYVKTVYPGMEYSFNTTKCESTCSDASPTVPLGFSTPNWTRGKFFLTSPPPDLRIPFKKHCNEQ